MWTSAVLLLLAAMPLAARAARPAACPAARYLVADGSPLDVDPAVVPGVVELTSGGQLVLSGCSADTTKLRASRRGTRVTGRAAACGTLVKVRFRGVIATPDCGTLTGVLKARGTPPARIAATRSDCGDGRIDAIAEQCDASASGGDAKCPGRCEPDCTCAPVQLPATSSTTAKSTTTSSTTTSSTAPATTSSTSATTTSLPGGSTSTTSGPTTTTLGGTTTSTAAGATTTTVSGATTTTTTASGATTTTVSGATTTTASGATTTTVSGATTTTRAGATTTTAAGATTTTTTSTSSTSTTSTTTTSSSTTTTTLALNYSLPPVFGSTALVSGFVPDPYNVGVVAGGPVRVAYLGNGCTGLATQAPTFSVNYTSGAFPTLRFYVTGTADTTMVINGPSASYVCSDDSFGTLNPTIDFASPSSGRYDVWIGTYAGSGTPSATLHVTEGTANHP